MDAAYSAERVNEALDTIDFPLDKAVGRNTSPAERDEFHRDDVHVSVEGGLTVVVVDDTSRLVINRIGDTLERSLDEAHVHEREPGRFLVLRTDAGESDGSTDTKVSTTMFETDTDE